jgi:hypothetical protein
LTSLSIVASPALLLQAEAQQGRNSFPSCHDNGILAYSFRRGTVGRCVVHDGLVVGEFDLVVTGGSSRLPHVGNVDLAWWEFSIYGMCWEIVIASSQVCDILKHWDQSRIKGN